MKTYTIHPKLIFHSSQRVLKKTNRPTRWFFIACLEAMPQLRPFLDLKGARDFFEDARDFWRRCTRLYEIFRMVHEIFKEVYEICQTVREIFKKVARFSKRFVVFAKDRRKLRGKILPHVNILIATTRWNLNDCSKKTEFGKLLQQKFAKTFEMFAKTFGRFAKTFARLAKTFERFAKTFERFTRIL